MFKDKGDAVMEVFTFTVITVDNQGKEIKRQQGSASYTVEKLAESVNLEMVAIPSGCFLMGSPENEEGYRRSQSPQHQVTLSSFGLSKYPITQAQWKAVAQFPPVNQALNPTPAHFVGENRPVEQVTWDEAVEFCARLSQKTGKNYRLPSESQWEYACRAASIKNSKLKIQKEEGNRHYHQPFHFGDTLTTDLANYSGVDWEYLGKICSKGAYGNAPLGADRRETTDVGYFEVANAFGLYDMHGNVREWCYDVWHRTYDGAPTDGTPWVTDGESTQRVIRGGSWNGSPHKCRSAYRGKFDRHGSLYDIGFRVVVYPR